MGTQVSYIKKECIPASSEFVSQSSQSFFVIRITACLVDRQTPKCLTKSADRLHRTNCKFMAALLSAFLERWSVFSTRRVEDLPWFEDMISFWFILLLIINAYSFKTTRIVFFLIYEITLFKSRFYFLGPTLIRWRLRDRTQRRDMDWGRNECNDHDCSKRLQYYDDFFVL